MARRESEATAVGGDGAEALDEGGEASVAAQEIPTGRFSRFLKLSALSAGASTRYLGQKVRGVFQEPEARAEALLKTHLETARRTVEVMGNLKGAVMKVGQMISLHPEHGFLPPELTAVFNKLQNQATTLPYPSIREQVIRELERPPEELFAWFDEQPMAAASLGQVHAARLHTGEPVVVKIQYPDIDRTVESDLWQLRALFKASGLVGRAREAEILLQEMRDRLFEELDYELEARNLELFRAYFRDEPRILIPRHHPELCSRRVLTMERLDGHTFEEVLERHVDQAWRDRLGVTLFELLMAQIMDFRHLHADPQLGNYRFLDDGRVIMLDLGCVKRFEAPFIEPYLDLLLAGAHGDRAGMARCVVALGVAPEGDDAAQRLVLELAEVLLEPIRVVPYQFGDEGKILGLVKAAAPKFLTRPEIQAHPDFVFLHRTYAGMYFILTRLRARADWRSIFLGRLERYRQAEAARGV